MNIHRNTLFAACLGILTSVSPLTASAQSALKPHFDASTGTIVDSRWKSGVPLGGLGVGKIELMTDGSFGDFTNQGNWDRPYGWAKGAFAAVRVQSGKSASIAKVLRLTTGDEYAGLSDVRHTRTIGMFPRIQTEYKDADLPITVTLNAFSPLIPHDVKNSALPVACLSYRLTNPTKQTVTASVLLAWPNLLGWGGRSNSGLSDETWNSLSGDTQEPSSAGALKGLRYTTTQSYAGQHQNAIGEDFVGARQEAGVQVSTCPSWDAAAPTPAFWNGFTSSGRLQPIAGPVPVQPAGAVSGQVTLAPGESRTVRFYVVWAMPHLVTFRPTTVYGPDTTASKTDIDALFDGDSKTRWSTDRAMQPGDAVVLDLGRAVTPTQITLDSGTEGTDYPHGLRVEVSGDGKLWQGAASLTLDRAKASTRQIALAPISGRYLRLTNLGADSYYWWSIYGLTVHVKEQADPLTLTADAATAYLANTHATTDGPGKDVGHFWQNWWHGAPEIAAYTDKNADTFLAQTQAWQAPVLNSSLPFWLKLKLINCAFPVVSNSILTCDGHFTELESPIDMAGALGTMDQRMASHAFYTDFFPELDRAELELFASCQQPDGRITHFVGNVHEAIGDPDVGYGITDWPDLSCSWIMQAVKLYRWTGDKAFLTRMQPHITSAMTWLDNDGKADDHIPTGGSTYDYEHMPPGAFIYSASCYLGALRAASAISDAQYAKVYDARLAQTQQSVMTNLWNGTYFRKWKQPATGQAVEDSFIASLAGDWLARLSGLPRTLAPDIIHRSIVQTIVRHQKAFFPIPPMQVTPEGKSTTTACFVLQHEPYVGCEAIYENYTGDGLETLHRVYDSAWEMNHSPWDQSLIYNAPVGTQGGLINYMTGPTSWFVLNALGGTSLDLPHGTLYVSPRLTSGQTALHIPVYFSRFWGRLDYVPASHILSLHIDKVFPLNAGIQSRLYHASGTPGDMEANTIMLTTAAADGDGPRLVLPKPFIVCAGATLDLSSLMTRLGLPKTSEVIAYQPKPAPNRQGLSSVGWTLTDNLHDSTALSAALGQEALDGDEQTRWTTDRPMQPGDALTLDMGRAQTIAKIVLDDAQSPTDYPHGFTVMASNNGQAWHRIAHASESQVTAAQQNGTVAISFVPLSARVLRIINTGTAPGLYWSVNELTVFGSAH